MVKVTSLFSQLLHHFPRSEFASAVKKHEAERHGKGFKCWTQFVAMLFCQLAKAESLRAALLGLERTLAEPDPFEPAASTRAFRITSPDLFDLLVLPALQQHIEREAPGIELRVTNSFARLAAMLETGDVDLAILPVLLGPEPFDLGPPVSQELRRRTMVRDRFCCFVRADHPALTSRRKLSPLSAGGGSIRPAP